MSRSLVGSSSSSTFGSSISSRISCRRRRSPPERSRTSVRAFSPRKPKRSHEHPGGDLLAVAERRAAADLLQRLEHAQVARDLGRVLREVGEPHGRAALDRAGVGLELAGQQLDQRRLARAVDADERDAVARAEPPGDAARARAGRRRRRDTSTASSTLSPSRAPRSAAARRGRATSGSSAISALAAVDAELRLRRARRRPAAQPRELLAQQLLAAVLAGRRPGGRARRGRARRPRSRPRTGGRSPSTTSHVAVQTASRNQRSWVTTSIDPRRAARWRASQSTPSTSRWLVGSSSSSSSGSSSSSRASAIRRRSPPESGAIRCPGPAGSGSARRRRAGRRARCGTRASPAHSWSARAPTSSSRIVRGRRARRPGPSSASCEAARRA